MKTQNALGNTDRIYRVDTFVVPESAREEFLSRVRPTHELLRTIPGFIQDFVLERPAGPGHFTLITIVEWASEAPIPLAAAAVKRLHEEMNFSPRELFIRLGIEAERGEYRQSRIDLAV